MPPKTQRERDDDARRAELEQIEEQVKSGQLVIRKMTAKERAAYQAKRGDQPAPPARERRKRTRRMSPR
jgi:hypothetical protein